MRTYILSMVCSGAWICGYADSEPTMSDCIPPDALVFDIGANRGEKTDEYLNRGARHIISVEPIPYMIDLLNNKYLDNSRVSVVPMGISDHIGKMTLFICSELPGVSSVCLDWKEGRFKHKGYVWDEEVEIAVTTLDELIERFGVPDFCKIDVEGHEYEILKGLTQPIPCLSFEFAYEFLEQKTRPCLDYLVELGYNRFNIGFAADPFFCSEKWLSPDEVMDILLNVPDGTSWGPLSWGDIYAIY
ncbi:MAG: FkbM family methyltransferase [Verrucomicrobia bacterium]|nr:FkbM family methyltransferase [Verrucomicrobiota bacterium]